MSISVICVMAHDAGRTDRATTVPRYRGCFGTASMEAAEMFNLGRF